jgi:hypothetical protein
MIPRKVRLMTVTFLMIFPYFTEVERIKRGYFAIGGEFLVLLLPLVFWVLCINFKDTVKVLKID